MKPTRLPALDCGVQSSSKCKKHTSCRLGLVLRPLATRVAFLAMMTGLLASCTGDSGGMPLPELSKESLAPQIAISDTNGVPRDPRNLTYRELIDGPEVLELDAVKLFRDVGVIEYLEDYIINIPTSAAFVAGYETSRALDSIKHRHADDQNNAVSEFEHRMLVWVSNVQLSTWTERGPEELHAAFFEVLEDCSRESPWPDVELFVMEGGRGGEVLPDSIESTPRLSYFEFQQVKHRCVRYAATYPTLDPVARDELLAPQRQHFAREMLDRIDNELPLVEVPPEYQAKIDDLRANGW